jgi:hypothetical protein
MITTFSTPFLWMITTFSPLFHQLSMDDHHFGYKQKNYFSKKTLIIIRDKNGGTSQE